jgi:hypothetical protein
MPSKFAAPCVPGLRASGWRHSTAGPSSAFALVIAAFLGFASLSACSSGRGEPRNVGKAYNPCGELQSHLVELQQIEDELADPGANSTIDRQNSLLERKRYLHRTDERLQKDCGR